MAFNFTDKYLREFVTDFSLAAMTDETKRAFDTVFSGKGAGADFLGWRDLPENYDRDEVSRIKKAAEKIIKTCDVFVVIGIGGSYLGARAAIEFVKGASYNNKKKSTPDVYFVGNDISSSHLRDVLEICEGKGAPASGRGARI